MADKKYIIVCHPDDKEIVEASVKRLTCDKKIEIQTSTHAPKGSMIFCRPNVFSPLEPEERNFFHEFWKKTFYNHEPKEMNTILKVVGVEEGSKE